MAGVSHLQELSELDTLGVGAVGKVKCRQLAAKQHFRHPFLGGIANLSFEDFPAKQLTHDGYRQLSSYVQD